MSDFAARIRRVRMKGGADVHILKNDNWDEGGEDYRGTILANARTIADHSTDDAPLVGYLVIGIFSDGGQSCAYRIDHEECPIPATLMPAYLAEIARRNLLMDPEARGVFNEMFEWQD